MANRGNYFSRGDWNVDLRNNKELLPPSGPSKMDYRNDPSLSIPIHERMKTLGMSVNPENVFSTVPANYGQGRPLPTADQMQNSLLPSIQSIQNGGMPTPMWFTPGKYTHQN